MIGMMIADSALTARARSATGRDDIAVLRPYDERTQEGAARFLSITWACGTKRATVMVPRLPPEDKPVLQALDLLLAKVVDACLS